MEIKYSSGSIEFLDTIQLLWENLNQHHGLVSLYFKEDFRNNSFEQRKARLSDRYKDGKLRIDLACHNVDLIGYCISGIREESVGEIESIFIVEEYRGLGVGDTLMQHALDWLDGQGVTLKVIDVAVGNERAYQFYARFGFYPRVTTLRQIGESPQ